MLSLAWSIHDWLIYVGGALQWAAQELRGPGIMLVAVADSSFLSFPEGNDFLIVALSINATWGRMAYYVTMTIIGSICGCLLLYFVGRRGGSPLLKRKFPRKDIERAERLYEKYGLLTVAVPSILPPPCPFKVFVLTAGVFRLKVSDFVIAVVIGRTIRYATWGILAVLYGNSVKLYMRDNLKWLGTGLFAFFLLLFGTLIYLYWKRLRRIRREVESAQAE
jgi:membrane protein YqaA with SNARE-associated domain